MKKTYMIPQTLVVRVAQTLPLMGSTDMTIGNTPTSPEDFEVKSATNNFSVWSDDWSAE